MSTTAIVPRWEWRCFAPSLTNLAQAASLPADAVPRDSDETYILDLSARLAQNVKIRDGVLDVKRLLQTDTAGLELWEPVLKARFPLGRKDIAAVFGPCLPPAALTSSRLSRPFASSGCTNRVARSASPDVAPSSRRSPPGR